MTQHFRREDFSHQAPSEGAAHDAQWKVVVLNPWGAFGQYGEREILEDAGCAVEIIEDRTEEGMLRAVRDADGLYYTGPVTRQMLRAMDRCKVIAASSIGMDRFEDFDLATEKGIVVCNCPGVFVDEVANQAMALLLACVRWLVPTANFVKGGGWADGTRQRPWGAIPRMTGQTIGIVGLGDIGKAMARRAAGFDMHILATDPYIAPETLQGIRRAAGLARQAPARLRLHLAACPAQRRDAAPDRRAAVRVDEAGGNPDQYLPRPGRG